MLNIYIYKKVENLEHLNLLDHYLGRSDFGAKRSGDEAISLLKKQFFNLVDSPEKADYFLIPHNYLKISDNAYVDVFINLSQQFKKKILIFSYGDSDDIIDIPNSIIFRTSSYKSSLRSNEIIMPAIADDLMQGELVIHNKRSVPVVGFCGWASLDGLLGYLKQYLKSLQFALLNSPRKKGILFRIQILNILKKSKLLETDFIIRKSYSGNEKTRIGNFVDLRNEYIENIKNSDFSLAVKGDGNFSIRFYEILSLGRVPLFVDTDCLLPLEDVINYNDFILRVDYRNIKKIDKTVSEFYLSLSNDKFVLMQNKAREMFGNYLRIDKYFEYVLNKDFLKKYD